MGTCYWPARKVQDSALLLPKSLRGMFGSASYYEVINRPAARALPKPMAGALAAPKRRRAAAALLEGLPEEADGDGY